MPRKTTKKNIKKEKNSKNPSSQFKLEESYVSLSIGIIVVILIIVGIILLFKNKRTFDTSSLQYKPAIDLNEKKSETSGGLPTYYQIKEGDNLWKISEKFYKSGYNWIDIAKANDLANPNIIHVGNKLAIPNVKQKTATVVSEEIKLIAVSDQITGTTYKVRKGDNLWNIAVRAYGDGYQWVKIADANKLTDPNLIFSDNLLKIPR